MTTEQRAHIPKQEEQSTRFTPTEALALIRAADGCPPLTGDEVAKAVRHRQQAGKLLAAAVLCNLYKVQHPSERTSSLYDLQAYLAKTASTVKPGVPPQHHGAAAEKRAIARQASPQKRRSPGVQPLQGFAAVLATTVELADNFDRKYAPDGILDFNALEALYTATDAVEHPALTALPPTREGDPRRDAIIHADRILRCLVVAATATTPELPPEGV